jgi:hypothetical protein
MQGVTAEASWLAAAFITSGSLIAARTAVMHRIHARACTRLSSRDQTDHNIAQFVLHIITAAMGGGAR